MIKSIFISAANMKGIEKSGSNHLIITEHGISKNNWQKLQDLKIILGISLDAFVRGGCAANPKAKEKLFKKIDYALNLHPQEIWLDHFRFDGHWEAVKGSELAGMHQKCQFCQNINKAEFLSKLAQEIMDYIGGRVKVGYFAVPFIEKEYPQFIKGLGQDHQKIGKIFDMSSPMLYHRMINKPVTYISKYVDYLYKKTEKPVLPIIQIKDMPDDLEDKMGEEEITQAFYEAIKEPSSGVCFFWWQHAIEKGKTKILSKLLSSV